ncbi:hypothetical protein EZV73_20305 [Acidaminobacter sp. JC074]|uniref:hypothetical protein n=1 Tax=Acidaminobacter sp. JC074 TaxID=2530199 RepID=UPI001F112D84|nr:hypothetical protein [Acidaminobacter sp. JC074]MCH4889934.1 hypothetical protein [Acidaminobacter sp. JC074]
MIKKIIILVMCLSLIGCQLAKEDGAKVQSKDELMGVYITFDYVDLFDMEKYLEENASKIVAGKDIIIEDDQRNRLYATYNEDLVDKYDFGIEGVLFANLSYTDEYGEVYKVSGDGYIHEVHIGSSNTSESIEGTLYLKSGGTRSIYTNPVYQTEDGQVYMLTGTGISASEGSFGQTISESTTETIDGITSEKSFEVKVNVELIEPADAYVFKQFNEDDEMIKVEDIDLNNIPKSVQRDGDTAYMILEYCHDGQVVDRTLISDEDYMSLNVFGDSKAAKGHYVSID